MIESATEMDSLQALFAEERPRLLRLCARLCGNASAAEDLVQETLLEAWRNAAKLTSPEGASRWLTAIARNVCLRWQRSAGREAARQADLPTAAEEDAPDWEQVVAEAGDPAVDLERDEMARVLDQALALLTPEARAVVLARYLEDLPQAEVARKLGMTESAVAVRLHRGKLALRRALAADLGAEDGLADSAAPRGETGWRETGIWCTICGKRRLLGRLSPARGELVLRCLDCDPAVDIAYCHHISYVGLLDGVSGFKPAYNRVLRWVNTYYRAALADTVARCLHCGRLAPVRMGFPPDHPAAAYELYAVHVACAACGYPQNNASLDAIILGLPEGMRFWREHQRMHRLPAREIEAQGVPALVVGFESETGSARLQAVVTQRDFSVLGIHTSPGA